jgi:guanylate kinase
MSKLIVVSAPSGAGKTTLCQRLLQDLPGLTLSISSTTRKPRGDEKNGREYFFHTVEEFKHKIEKQEFAEWAEVHGNYYGTSKNVIEKAFAAHKSVLLDIDVQGAESLTRAYPGICHSFFIEPPSLQVLEERLRARKTDSEETIQKRIINAQREMDQASKFDRIIRNDELDRAYQELRKQVELILG